VGRHLAREPEHSVNRLRVGWLLETMRMRTRFIKVISKAEFWIRTASGMSSDVMGCRVSMLRGTRIQIATWE